MKYDLKDIKLATIGQNRIEWAEKHMPVVRKIRERFSKEKPLKGMRIAACLHVTSETANLARTLAAGGAEVFLCASNPLSTQDDIPAALVKNYGISVFAIRGVGRDKYYKHIKATLDANPHITIDDGADLVSLIHSEQKDKIKNIIAGMEETTTGVIRLRAMEKDNALLYPIFSVNDAVTKYLFDNRYGTGQSTLDGIVRATNILIAGSVVVVAGYGWCGRGFANRARGLGGRVVVTEVNPLKAIEAVMDGFEVMTFGEAAKIGNIFCSITGNVSVMRREHFQSMKDGAVICNSGHFNVEIDIPELEKLSKKINKNIRPNVDEYKLKSGKTIFLLGEGRLVNLACAEGHPAMVMDMSFATQALTTEHAIKNAGKLEPKVYPVPEAIEKWIASLKLSSMGAKIDTLTAKQEHYLSSWNEGT